MSENKRTIMLLTLLVIVLGFMWWTQNSYSTNFTDDLSGVMISATA